MADIKQIQFKRSNVAGKRPLPTDISEGELAINVKDATLFTKNDNGEIIDLGFAKGGSIDGDVIHVGNYTQTGDYSTSGNVESQTLTVKGASTLDDVTAKNITASEEIRTNAGLITSRAKTEPENAGIRFMSQTNQDRAVIFAPTQTETAGALHFRVKNGSGSTQGQVEFKASGDGDFTSPRNLVAGNQLISKSAKINGTIDQNSKPVGEYGLTSLVGVGSAAEGINNLRKITNGTGGTIFHEVIRRSDASKIPNEVAWYQGNGLENRIYGLSSDGSAQYNGSLSVGIKTGDIKDRYSALGSASISLGENGTGLKWASQGVLNIVSDNRISAAALRNEFKSLRKLSVGFSDNGTDFIVPPVNQALVEVYTDGDGTIEGNTLLGWYNSGKFSHYLRGKGKTYIQTAEGLDVLSGSTTVRALQSNTDITLYQASQASRNHIAWRSIRPSDNTNQAHAYIYKDSTGGNAADGIHINNGFMGGNEWVFKNEGDLVNPRHLMMTGGDILLGDQNPSSVSTSQRGIVGLRSSRILTDHGNGNVTICAGTHSNGGIGDLYLGYNPGNGFNTKNVLLYSDMRPSNNISIVFPNQAPGRGGFNAQNNEASMEGGAPIYQRIDDGAPSVYYPIIKQKYAQQDRTYSIGTLINSGEFMVHMYGRTTNNNSTIGGRTWVFKPDGEFVSAGDISANGVIRAGGAALGTDGNITGGSGNFANLNSSINSLSTRITTAQNAANTAQSTANGKWTYNQATIDSRVTAVGDGRYAKKDGPGKGWTRVWGPGVVGGGGSLTMSQDCRFRNIWIRTNAAPSSFTSFRLGAGDCQYFVRPDPGWIRFTLSGDGRTIRNLQDDNSTFREIYVEND